MLGEAVPKVDTTKLIQRDVMARVIEKRNDTTNQETCHWLAHMTPAIYLCKDTVLQLSEMISASGGLLCHTTQRPVRDFQSRPTR